jgi:hypothetical protein
VPLNVITDNVITLGLHVQFVINLTNFAILQSSA